MTVGMTVGMTVRMTVRMTVGTTVGETVDVTDVLGMQIFFIVKRVRAQTMSLLILHLNFSCKLCMYRV